MRQCLTQACFRARGVERRGFCHTHRRQQTILAVLGPSGVLWYGTAL